MLKSKKGATLIELVTVLAIIGIIITSIGSFFIMNLRSSKSSEEQLEVQYQLQNALSIFTDKLQNAKDVLYQDNGNEELFTLQFDENWDGSIDKTDVISLNKTTDKLTLNTVEVGAYIENIDLTPLDKDGVTPLGISQLNTAKIIEVTVTSRKGSTTSTLSTIVYIRNKS